MEIERLIPSVVASPAFERLLESGATTVEEVLRESLTFRLFRQEEARVVDFFVTHVDQLLKLAFSDNEMSAKAFAILEHSDPAVTAAMLKDQRFHRLALVIVGTTEANNLHLSRLASLTHAVLTVDQHFIMTSCGFILQLLSFAWETSVFDLFEYMCTMNENM